MIILAIITAFIIILIVSIGIVEGGYYIYYKHSGIIDTLKDLFN